MFKYIAIILITVSYSVPVHNKETTSAIPVILDTMLEMISMMF